MQLWNTSGNTSFNPAIAENMIPNFGSMSGAAQQSALTNFQGSDLGLQAGANGGQTGLQSLVYNAPTVGANGQMMKGGLNLDGIGSIMNGIGSAVSIYTALSNLGLAKDQFKFQKDAYNTNLKNQTQSYNTSLEDRTRARYHTQGGTSADVDSYLAQHSL